MRTFEQKQNQSRDRISSSLSRSKALISEPARHPETRLKLQRTLGNRALGQLLSGTAKESANGNRVGLPGQLKAGIENLSDLAMDDVKVHYNSSRPAEVQALAHTQGSRIYLGPGQETHLAHEAWHVVQQKQGRVKPTSVQAKGSSINDEPGLEREADLMGSKALKASSSSPGHTNNPRPSRSVQSQVVQRKKVPKDSVGPTDFGQFETTTFAPMNDSGVDIVLMFHPNDALVDATKIALVQSVKATNEAGTAYAVNPTMANRLIARGKGQGYTIDASGETNNPLYFDTKNLAPAEDLKDTPESSNAPGAGTLGTNTEYQTGFCFKNKPADPAKIKQSAALHDTPQGIKRTGAGMMFETTALAVDGNDKGKYYGSVKWGYKIGGTKAKPKVDAKSMTDIEPASKAKPTANFVEAAKLWNAGTTRGALEVNPTSPGNLKTAFVKYVAGTTGPPRQPKGTKLQLIDVIKGSTDPMIRAEILDPSGNVTGTIVEIYVADVKDPGGLPNKPLPIP